MPHARMAQPHGLRIKSHWFKAGARRRRPEQTASAMAFIAWRVAHNMLKRMRGAQFDIDAGPTVLRLHARGAGVPDRSGSTAWPMRGMDPATRDEFTTALVRHVARPCWTTTRPSCWAPLLKAASYADDFIDLFNEVTQHYAEFGADPNGRISDGFRPTSPSCATWAAASSRLMPAKDRRWVIDQVMAIEAPEAVDMRAGARCATCCRPSRAASATRWPEWRLMR